MFDVYYCRQATLRAKVLQLIFLSYLKKLYFIPKGMNGVTSLDENDRRRLSYLLVYYTTLPVRAVIEK